jgi:glutathione synthase/RimK-type ligase-like ATP-grasp enzyme
LRALSLVPQREFPEAWRWAVDVEARALRESGFEVDAQPWREPQNLDSYDVVLPLVTWGYQFDPVHWFGVIDFLEAEARCVLNPPSVLRWNTDKDYLVELGSKGVPTIPTRRFERLDADAIARCHDALGDVLVIKPPISGGAYGTHRIECGHPLPGDALGRTMLVQPFLPAIQSEGEYSLMFFAGRYSHAIIKRAKTGEYRVQPHLGGSEVACDPPPGSREVAEAALAAAPEPCAYARVDMIRGDDGAFRVIELELIEPSLWLDLAPGAPMAFADAVRGACQ